MTTMQATVPTLAVADADDFSHFVQFYESDLFLVESVARFVSAGLGVGDRALIIATPQHRHAIETYLRRGNLDLSKALSQGDLILLDARDTLASFIIDGEPDPTV